MATDAAWKGLAKLEMANERTLIDWLHLAAVLGVGAFVVAVLEESPRKSQLTTPYGVVSLGSLVLGVGAYLQYRWRRAMFEARRHVSFGGIWLPILATLIVGCLLVDTLGDYLLALVVPSQCMPLARPISVNATPPFLYLTMHGSVQPLRFLCGRGGGVSAVHRFSLADFSYAGPATDQRAALVGMPRSMAMARGVLFVADGRRDQSGLAVFGSCSRNDDGTPGVRPYLGVVRPSDPAMASSFNHPYGIAVAPDGSLHVSAQNGGAVVRIGLDAGDFSVVREVSAPVDVKENSYSAATVKKAPQGPLRDVLIDQSGCEHVAQREAHEILHYCPFDGPLVGRTSVPKPVGLVEEGGVLFVGSLGSKSSPADPHGPAVYSFDLPQPGTGDYRLTLRKRIAHSQMKHPAGMLAHNQALYVLDQASSSLLVFDLDGRFRGEALVDLPDAPEKMLLVEDEC